MYYVNLALYQRWLWYGGFLPAHGCQVINTSVSSAQWGRNVTDTPETFVKQAFTLHSPRFINLIPEMRLHLIICYSKYAGTILKFNGVERLGEVGLSHAVLLTSMDLLFSSSMLTNVGSPLCRLSWSGLWSEIFLVWEDRFQRRWDEIPAFTSATHKVNEGVLCIGTRSPLCGHDFLRFLQYK